MKIFISSIIRDFTPYREAATRACRTLKHEVTRAEEFGASPDSPQRVCLAEVRAADVVVLILGGKYGDPCGAEGRSATHEEYREARDRGDVLVFIQQGVSREPKQAEFVREVQAWSKGHYTQDFAAPDELQEAVIRALHELELSRKSGAVDEGEMLGRARALAPDRESNSASLAVIVAGAPKQQVIRPAELEAAKLKDAVMQAALFGAHRVFNPEEGCKAKIVRGQLLVEQESASILLTQLAEIRIVQPAVSHTESSGMRFHVLVEEDVQESIDRALRFGAWLLDHVDPKRRLGWVAPVAALTGGSYLGWVTRAEAERRPNSVTMGFGGGQATIVSLTPAARARASLDTLAGAMAEDFTVLMRRERKG